MNRSIADHPRIRGEHVADCAFAVALAGSSPHTRGARQLLIVHRRILRIIPAYAGSTVDCVVVGFPEWDHPRIRGEHCSLSSQATLAGGSSPHTRGAPDLRHQRRVERGIIPAYAGSTSASPTPAPSQQDHPRIRGEHASALREILGRHGSSPHTRGALSRCGFCVLPGRIIPAYAGSTHRSRWPYVPPGDHPRIRGEHRQAHVQSRRALGSSPHTRGAPRQRGIHHQSIRIIPAYAGSTPVCARVRSRRWDHPRIRGEHWSRRDTFGRAKGSSPHTRGAPDAGVHLARRPGIIPAYAGSTCLSKAFFDAYCGSSPHTRGARRQEEIQARHVRIIPAYAGSTFPSLASTSARRDHPRIRGEHSICLKFCHLTMGSSPHTRGAPTAKCRGPIRIADHPRIRGEHLP